ncbi:hypothetical protein FPOAC1_009317 [Fusarium poae]|uniref:hypothetical protein n=1 Tax=Fusarium poae TaxID=36050 RepID=UPI001CE7364C|nr:hypothetical protein FPOAC1_009317 [Fusarium poae]KAG8669915.1 hypothetical protein FPOAC1_009317 [Fusarium poae]
MCPADAGTATLAPDLVIDLIVMRKNPRTVQFTIDQMCNSRLSRLQSAGNYSRQNVTSRSLRIAIPSTTMSIDTSQNQLQITQIAELVDGYLQRILYSTMSG